MSEMGYMRTVGIAFLLAIFILHSVSGEIYFKKGAPHVTLRHGGQVSGKVDFSRDGRPYNSFRSIPFATIPKRFAEAQLIREPTWEGVMEAVEEQGPVCPQYSIMDNMLNPDLKGIATIGVEDCLSLSVHVPMRTTPRTGGYPVMVHVHGGAFLLGSKEMIGPGFLMDEDVIMVTINYRLGVFGFLSTEDHVVPGNNGLKDAVIALKWVQENIEQFGGNRDQVTIFGVSAGGAATHYLLLSNTTKGLMKGVISQSGSALHSWSYHHNPKELAVELATYMKCPTTASQASEISSEEILTCLSAAPLEELNKAQLTFKSYWPHMMNVFLFAPTPESDLAAKTELTPFLTESPYSIMTRRDIPITEIPWMVGATEDEGAGFLINTILNNEHLSKDLNENWDEVAASAFLFDTAVLKEEQLEVAQKLRKFYFGSKLISQETEDDLVNIYSDSRFTHGIYKSAIEVASRGEQNPVYLYQFAQPPKKSPMSMLAPEVESSKKRVTHGDDMVFLSDASFIPGAPKLIEPDTVDEYFSKHFIKLWAGFATHGKPTHSWGNAEDREWKPISKKEVNGDIPLRYFRIQENPRNIENPYKERMDFWDQLYKDHYEKTLMPEFTKANNKIPKVEL